MPRQLYTSKKLTAASKVMLAAIVVQIILGAFVAGLKAGFSYNTYPLMNGEIFPSHIIQSLTWLNFLENGATVQFIHRWVAVAVLLLVLYF
jgi:heme a synthase